MFEPLSIPFDGYSTALGGHVVGEQRVSPVTGKKFRLVQAHSVVINDAFAIGEPVVKVGADGCIGTQDVSAGLDASDPIPLGFAASACPESTGSATYYFWVQVYGRVETSAIAGPTGGTLAGVPTNGDDDIAIGDSIITATTTDNAVNSVAAATATDMTRYMGYALAADDDSANTVGVFANVGGAAG